MSSSPRSVLHVSLFALAIALGALLALDRGRPTTSELDARADNLVPVVRRDDLTALRIIDRAGQHTDLTVRRLVDTAGSARYVLGDAGAAEADLDPAAVDGLLSALEFAKWHEPPRTLGAGEALDLGALDLEIRLEMGAVTARILIFGPAPSRPNLRQVEVTATGAPRRTGLVSASLLERVGRDRSAFESRLLLPVGRDRTESLTLTRAAGSVTLRSDGRGFLFEDQAGVQRRVGREALDRVFFQLARTTIEAPLSSPSGSAHPRLELRQKTRASGDAKGGEYTLLLGEACPGHPELVAAERTAPSKLSGCVPASVLTGVSGALDALGDRSLVPLGPDEIDHLIVESVADGGGRRLDLVRDGAEFMLRAPSERPLELDTGNSFLSALLEARQPGRESPSLTPTARLRVFGHPPGATETAEFVVELLGEPGKAGWSAARRLDDGVLLALDQATSWSLSEDATWFEGLEIVSIEPDSIQQFETITQDGTERLRGAESTRDLTFADGSPADRSLTGAALALLHPLKALRWLPPRSSTAGVPLIVVEITKSGGEKSRVVVEERVRGGYAAHLDGRRGRFVLPVRTVSTWLRSLVDRAPATLVPSDYAKVELRSGGLEQRLLRQGEHLALADEVDDGFGAAVEEALLGFVPIAARRGAHGVRTAPALDIAVTTTRGETITFHVHGPTTFEGISVYELSVGTAERSYFIEAGAVRALLDLL